MSINLERFPRRHYTAHETPIEFLENFTKVLGGPNVYAKRDDLLGLTSGGNKTRKLEFLMADALNQGADTVITCGAVQSNHCRLTLSAAVKEGLKCVLVLEERVPNSYNPKSSGNNFLFNLLGVDNIKVVPAGSDMMVEMGKVAKSLEEEGRKPYVIPGGGSNDIGALGYVNCVKEMLKQAKDEDLKIDYIVAASGSAGTHAGLIAGLYGEGSDIPVVGINVSRDKETQEKNVRKLANETAQLVGLRGEVPASLTNCFADYVGPGYSIETDEMIEAVQLLARTEGILLDPVYTGKVMAGLIDLSRNGYFKKDENVLFLHTGGSPALYVNPDVVLKDVKTSVTK